MPWSPADAPRHQKLATTSRLKRMWRDIANAELAKHGDDARAIKAANAIVHREADKAPEAQAEEAVTDDFTLDDAKAIARRAEFTVFWSVPNAAYSMGYFTLMRAMEAFDELKRSASVTSISLRHGEEQIARHDVDPYAWHDVRMMVGR